MENFFTERLALASLPRAHFENTKPITNMKVTSEITTGSDCPAASCSAWIACKSRLPREGVVVDTIIDDENGKRNEAKLKRNGNLWFLADGSMYVYYTPTHWRNPSQNDLAHSQKGRERGPDNTQY